MSKGKDLPEEWKIAHIKFICIKKMTGDRRQCLNYRGRSVTSTINKVYG